MGTPCYTTVLTNTSTLLVSRVFLYDASTSSEYSVAALLTFLLCRVQSIAAQSILSRRWPFNVLLRHTLFTPITLVFLGPLQNKLISEEYDRPREPLPLSQHTNFTRRHRTHLLRGCGQAALKEQEGPEHGPHQGLDEGKRRRLDTLKRPKSNSGRKNDLGHSRGRFERILQLNLPHHCLTSFRGYEIQARLARIRCDARTFTPGEPHLRVFIP